MPLTRARLLELLGTMPGPAPLDGQVEARFSVRRLGDQDRYGVARERVTYQVEPGERVAAYLFVPFRPGTRPGRRAAGLCLHQHAGQFDLGKSEPAGLAGNPEQHYALELARRGYVTLVADHLCFEERRDPVLEGAAFERYEFTRRVSLGSCLQAKYSSDAVRGLDYLAARGEGDPARAGRPRLHRPHACGRVRLLRPLAPADLRGGTPMTSPSVLIPTSVIGSYAIPSWLWTGLDAIKEGKYGPTDQRELFDDAVQVAMRDQERAGIDVISDGEMRRWYFVQGFYGRMSGLEE